MTNLSVIDWSAVAAITAVFGLLLTGIGSIYAGMQLRISRKIAAADFDFRLYEQIREFHDVDRRLKGEGWPDGKAGPVTPEEWYRVRGYMGLLESLHGLVEAGIIDLNRVDIAYSGRIFAIVSNPIIYQKELVGRQGAWENFIKIWRSLEKLPVYRSHASKSPGTATSQAVGNGEVKPRQTTSG